MDAVVSLGLVGLIVFQQAFYLRQIQKLIDKLMSRDLTEYQRAVTPTPPREKQPEYQPFAEDLSVLNRI
jgi:hypothetical protein